MKSRIFIVLSIICTALASCNLNSESNFVPQMSIWASHNNKTDTVKIQYTQEVGVIKMDTINVGDTLLLRLYLDGLTNNLTDFNIVLSDTSLSKIILPKESAMDSVFSKSASNYSAGKFTFLSTEKLVFFPIRYVAKKSDSNSGYIQFTLSSDANFKTSEGSNITAFKLIIPAKVKTPLLN